MAIMRMGTVECTVKYVDADIATAGDGSVPAEALDTLPSPDAMANDTVYLCRRNESTHLSLITASKTNGNNIYLIGMPKFEDPLYLRVPQEAKTAWDADVSDFARCRFSTADGYIRFAPIDNFGVHRIWFERPSNGNCNQTYGALQVDGNGVSDGNLRKSSFFMTNCKWTDQGVELDNEAYVTNSSVQSGTAAFRYARTVHIENNHFEWQGRHNERPLYISNVISTYACCIHVGETKRIVYNNNVSYMTTCGRGENHRADVWLHTTSGIAGEIFHTNNRQYLIAQNFNNHYIFELNRIHASKVVAHNNEAIMWRYYNRSAVTYCIGSRFFNYSFGYYENRYSITDILADSGEMGNIGSMIYIGEWDNQDYIYLEQRNGNKIERVTAKTNDTGLISVGGVAMDINVSSATSVKDITAWNASWRGLNLRTISPNNWTRSRSPMVRNASIRGGIQVINSDLLEITDWMCNSPATSNLGFPWFTSHAGLRLTTYSSSVYIKTAQINADSSFVAQRWLKVNHGQDKVIIDEIDVPLTNDYIHHGSYSWDLGVVAVNNILNVPGNWYSTTGRYMGQSWGAYREGGAAGAIRLSSNAATTADSSSPLTIGPKPFRALEWTPNGTGPATLNVFVAHKLYSAASDVNNRFKVILEVPYMDGDIQRIKEYTSSPDGWWEEDTDSVWVNDVGLTQWKLVLPFIVQSSLLPVTARIEFDWFDPNGYLYLDPKLVFELNT